jgi:glycosyltransferase involved in cell wall biosynthesis
MKILYLNNIPSPYRVEFFNELGKHCQLTVLFERPSASDRDRRWRGEAFHHFNGIFLKGKNIGTDASFCPEVIRYLKQDYDAIILGGYSSPTYMLAMEYMKHRKICFLMNADGGFIKSDSWYMRKIKTHYIGMASGWLSSGGETDKYLKYYGADSKYIYQYPFSSVSEKQLCQPDEKEKRCLKEQLGLKENRVAIAVGQFISRKGFDYLIQAAGKIPKEYGVILIGGHEGTEFSNLREINSATNVHFLDFMSKEQLSLYYRAADIFVFPTREDIWGLVLNEAMSYGLPSVASVKANASIELIEEDINGYLIDPENIELMAERMLRLFQDDNKRILMGLNALKTARNFTIEKMALQHIDIIKRWKKCMIGGS